MASILMLTCPRCHTESGHGGYPSDPVLSTVMCLHCGYGGPGGGFTHHHPDGEQCSVEQVVRLVDSIKKEQRRTKAVETAEMLTRKARQLDGAFKVIADIAEQER